MEEVYGVSLKKRDGDGLALVAMHDARAFTENFNRTDSGATAGENVCVENFVRRAAKISAGDALDEAGNVNVRGTGGCAGRVEAVEASMGLKDGSLRRERRLEFGEARMEIWA